MPPATELLELADELDRARASNHDPKAVQQIARLQEAATDVGKAFSGSWLGYHSRVYYKDFNAIPAGAHFSQEWGFLSVAFSRDTVGNWVEYAYDDVISEIYRRASNPDLASAHEHSVSLGQTFEDIRSKSLSLFTIITGYHSDEFLEKIKNDIASLKVHSEPAIFSALAPSGQLMSRDTNAIQQGIHCPPHMQVLIDIMALDEPARACGELVELCRRASSHLARQEQVMRTHRPVGTKIFIGHGRSLVWKELKDFIQDRLGLPWDEFNRVPIAGITTVTRLVEMLDNAAMALLVMTAEDEQKDGKLHARMNVVHEAGLFQGRLGFTRAIVLLEEGCEEFSNIQGLGQLRFPNGQINARFEDVRLIFEREGLL